MNKKNIILAVISLVMICSSYIQCQNHKQESTNVKLLSIDSISNISINKIIYYKKPIEIFNGNIMNERKIPDWFEAYSLLNGDYQYFKNKPESAVEYIHSSCGSVSKSFISQKLNDSIFLQKQLLYWKKTPYTYIFGEVWIHEKTTNIDFVVVLSKISDRKIEIGLKDPIKKNNSDEPLDSVRYVAWDESIFIIEDNKIKLPDQYFASKILENENGNLDLTLSSFKNLAFRHNYIKSDLDGTKQRQYESFIKQGDKHYLKNN